MTNSIQSSLYNCPCCLGNYENIHDGKKFLVDTFSVPIFYDYAMCVSCGHYFVSNPLNRESLDIYYNSSTQLRRLDVTDIENKVFEKQANCIEKAKMIAGSSVLEIGCDTGQFLSFLKKHGAGQTFYIESSEKAVQLIQKEGVHKSVDELTSSGVDIVVARHVLEHVDDPKGFIDYLSQYLNKDGIMMFEVPDHSDSGPGCDAVYFEHLHHFSISSIGILLDRSGMRPIAIEFDQTKGYGTTENRVIRILVRKRYMPNNSRKETFIEHFKQTNSYLYKAVDDIISNTENVVALYAASWISKDIILNSSLCTKNIDSIYDGDPQKIGNKFLTFSVKAPDSIVNSKVNTIIICSSYYKEIEKNIRSFGYDGRVIYYADLLSPGT